MAKNKAKLNKFLTGAVTATMVATAVVPAVGAASFSDVKDADDIAAVDKAVELGFFQGNADGTFTPYGNITRGQAAKTLARYIAVQAGFVNEDGTADLTAYALHHELLTTVTPFDDVPLTHSDQELVVASGIIKHAGVMTGSNNNLQQGKNINRAQMASVLVRAFGLEDLPGDLSKVTDADNVDASHQANIHILSENGVTTETSFRPFEVVKRVQMAKFLNRSYDVTHSDAAIVSVSAINAKTIEVKFNTAVDTDKAVIEAKRGAIKPSVKAIKYSDDKKSATIEFNAVMAAGDYTVSVTGLTEEALTGTVKVEAEKLTVINFLSDAAVISGDNVVTNVIAENQYGEDITAKLATTNPNISVSTSKGTTNASTTITKEGLLTVVGTSGLFKVDDKVVVTVVDSATGVTSTKTLTVAQAAAVESIALGDIKTDDVELAEEPVNVTNMDTDFAKYYVPVTIKDQYGNTLKAADLVGVNVLSSNEKIAKVASPQFVDVKDVGTVIKFAQPTATATHGTAVLTVVAAGTGKTASVSVKVLEDPKTDVLTVSAPETAIKETVKTELPFSAADQYGNALVSSTELVRDGGSSPTVLKFTDGSSITATGATIDYSVDYGNKNKVKLHITPNATNVVLTAVSATGKAQTLNLTAEETPEAASLAGLSKDIYTAIQKGENQTINFKDVIVKDQYGEDIALPNGFTLTFAAVDSTLDTITLTQTTLDNTSTTATVANAAVKGTEAIEISLVDGSSTVLDTITVNMETVELKDISSFGLKDLGKLYSGTSFKYGNASADYDKALEIFGKKGSTEVLVAQSLLVSATATTPIVVGSAALVQTNNQNATSAADKTATLTGVIAGANDPITVTQTVTYSDAQSVVTDVIVRKTAGAKVTITDGAVVVPAADIVTTKKIGAVGADSTFQFYAKDQYGVVAKELSYTVTNLKSSTASAVTVANDGEVTVTGTALVAGDTFTITAIVDGVVKSIKVIVGA